MDGGPANRRPGKVKESKIHPYQLGPIYSLQYENSDGKTWAQSRSNSVRQLKIKPGVTIVGRHFDPEILRILTVARETAPELTDNTVWITGAYRKKDGRHSTGEAFDFRIKNVKGFKEFIFNKDVAKWAERMRKKLGPDYDVIYGDSEHLDHIHCEYDPKEKLTIKAA